VVTKAEGESWGTGSKRSKLGGVGGDEKSRLRTEKGEKVVRKRLIQLRRRQSLDSLTKKRRMFIARKGGQGHEPSLPDVLRGPKKESRPTLRIVLTSNVDRI